MDSPDFIGFLWGEFGWLARTIQMAIREGLPIAVPFVVTLLVLALNYYIIFEKKKGKKDG
jgi:hypothetical protein